MLAMMTDAVAIALIGVLSSAILGANAMLSASLSRRALRDIAGDSNGVTLHEALNNLSGQLAAHIAEDHTQFASIDDRLTRLGQ